MISGKYRNPLNAELGTTGTGRERRSLMSPTFIAERACAPMQQCRLEGLSDRDAANALRTNIAWKVAAGLALDDEGIHYSVLTYWQSRLRASDRPERIFDAVRAAITETRVLKGKQRRALDSTLLDDAVATQDTVTQLVAAIRRVRRLVPETARLELGAHDYDASGQVADRAELERWAEQLDPAGWRTPASSMRPLARARAGSTPP